jgi:hypothetical protein
MILSLKISSFVYENISSLHTSDEITHVLDFDENEEKKELDENEKMHQPILASSLQRLDQENKRPSSNSLVFGSLYFKYTTPPPELI